MQAKLRMPDVSTTGAAVRVLRWLVAEGEPVRRGQPLLEVETDKAVTDVVAPAGGVVEEAVELLAQRLGTPLQIERYLTSALEEGWRVGEKPVTAQLVEALLSPQLDGLEPRLRRHGYDIPDLAELINARQGEIRSLLRGELEPARGQELTAKLMAAGLPI